VQRQVCITGYGLLNAFGDDPAAIWSALDSDGGRGVAADSETFAPFTVFPAAEHDVAAQVPRPGDQRAMGPMMLYGAYAAGLALEMAGLKDNEAYLERINLLVASGGGERDWELDEQIIAGLNGGQVNDREAFLNQQLSDGLRPTLFLAQLPNLFAGNISIVHKVAGSSRTFMGEEQAAVDALRIGYSRIAAGTDDIVLVGAAYNAERPDMLLMMHAGQTLLTDKLLPVWDRPQNGVTFGSAGAFIVLEARESAEARGVSVRAELRGVASGRATETEARLKEAARQSQVLVKAVAEEPLAVLSGATGATDLVHAERQWLGTSPFGKADMAVRATASALGHPVEATFIQNAILATLAVERQTLFAPLYGDAAVEALPAGPIRQAAVTGWGMRRGVGTAIIGAVGS